VPRCTPSRTQIKRAELARHAAADDKVERERRAHFSRY
jgi:hypothetical protein